MISIRDDIWIFSHLALAILGRSLEDAARYSKKVCFYGSESSLTLFENKM